LTKTHIFAANFWSKNALDFHISTELSTLETLSKCGFQGFSTCVFRQNISNSKQKNFCPFDLFFFIKITKTSEKFFAAFFCQSYWEKCLKCSVFKGLTVLHKSCDFCIKLSKPTCGAPLAMYEKSLKKFQKNT